MRTFVGAWVRFDNVNEGELAFIHTYGRGITQNAIWCPSKKQCCITVGIELENGWVVPETDVTDEMWAALAAWRLR